MSLADQLSEPSFLALLAATVRQHGGAVTLQDAEIAAIRDCSLGVRRTADGFTLLLLRAGETCNH